MTNKEIKIMQKKMLIILLFGILFFSLAIGNMGRVSALGITPGRTTVNFEPGLERNVPFSVLNNEHKEMQVILLVQGELNASITLLNNNLEFLSSEDSKSFNYNFKLPEKLAPGLHTADVVALEIPRASEDGTYVGATVAVVSQLYVYVPYPGKYVDIDLNILNAEKDSTATFIVPVISRGKLGIGDARAIIDIYTPLNEKIATLDTDYAPLEPGARTELSAKWPVNVDSGNYLAKVTVFYDGESKSIEKQFGIGVNMLSIESILVNEFNLGEIAKLKILVENRWNQELKSVFANLIVFDKDSQIMADVKSAAENIPSLSKKELIAYWDTIGVQEGEYNGKLVVVYGEKSTDKNLILKISENALDVVGIGYAIMPKGGTGIKMTTILTVLVIILIIINITWFVFFRLVIKGRGNEKRK